MIIAFEMNPHDGDAFFFEDRKSSIFCPTCRTLLVKDFLPTGVRPRKKWDVCSSYENRIIVTDRFKAWCEAQQFDGLRFRQVCDKPPYFVFEPSIALGVDSRCARFVNKCSVCGNYESIVRSGPLLLSDVSAPIETGFFRTDIEFASNWEKSPIIIVGTRTKDLIKQEKFRLIDFEPIKRATE
jgi:hypothetical protein